MIMRGSKSRRRTGATVVETAVVLPLVLFFIFSVFQFGRMFMDWNVLNNAAREGCRYALVNNTSATVSSDVSDIVTARMAGEKNSFSTFSVTVTGTHLGVNTPVNNLVAGDFVTVTVTGTFKFLSLPIPSPTTMNMTSAVTMICEGAM